MAFPRRPARGPTSAALQPTPVDQAIHRVGDAARAFEKRWTLATLRRVDPQLHALLIEQQADWHASLLTGDVPYLVDQTSAMCRGWAAAVKALETREQPEDAFLVGMYQDFTVIISEQRQDLGELKKRMGTDQVVVVTPDEVAAMVVGLGDTVKAVKDLWPEAEIFEVRKPEGKKGDGQE